MEGVYKELDEVKAELEKLKEQYQIKTQLSESLRRSHTEQQVKLQEAKLQIEKQAKELNATSNEIVEVRQHYEDIKSKLRDSETSLKQVSSMNDRLRIESGEKLQKLEGENRKLVSDLEEATGRNDDLERKLLACNEEIEGLKVLLSDSQKKCLEAEQRAIVGKELRQRDDVILRLEEKTMNIQEQLKWKKEQFEHLEQAHKLLQDQFESSKNEWTSQKSTLLEEISILESKLDSQIRITKTLESQLKMCNQALAHEESKRKVLEVQLSESKQCFENVSVEFEEAKAKIEILSTKRDEEIASLRSSLGMKEIEMKEMNYRFAHLEQENKELLGSVKELQEAQISKRKPDPSLTKLRNKLKDLENVHSKCALTLKEKEDEWNSTMEKLIGDMKFYESDLKMKSEQMHQLKMELDNCHSAMEVSSEEASLLFMVLKSELSHAYSKLFNTEAQTEAFNKEMGHCSPLKAQVDLNQARKEISSLTQKLDSLNLLEERRILLENEVEEHKKMLEESLSCQIRLKEQVNQMEIDLKNVYDALKKSNSELAAKISEARQAEMEMQVWKSKAESLRTCLEENQKICKQMEISLLEQVETEKGLRKENDSLQWRLKDQEQKIEDLQQKLVQKEAIVNDKEAQHIQIVKEKNATIENLEKEIEKMEQQSMSRECARLEAENKFEREKEKLNTITREKDEHISSLEHNFVNMFLFSLSKEVENLVKMNALEDDLEKTKLHMNSEMEKKNKAIDVLEMEVSNLQAKMLLQEESLFHSNQSAKKLETLLEDKKFEMEKLAYHLREEQTKLKDIELEKQTAMDNIKRLSLERDYLLGHIEEFCEQMGEFCVQDVKLEAMLGKLLQNSEEDDRFRDPEQKDVNYSWMTKEVGASLDRSPLREINE